MEKPAAVKETVAAKKKSDRLDVLGVGISHPDRVIFEDTGVTKGQLAEFYAAASPWMLKDLANHPISLLRCPEGTEAIVFSSAVPAWAWDRTSCHSAGNARENPMNISI